MDGAFGKSLSKHRQRLQFSRARRLAKNVVTFLNLVRDAARQAT